MDIPYYLQLLLTVSIHIRDDCFEGFGAFFWRF